MDDRINGQLLVNASLTSTVRARLLVPEAPLRSRLVTLLGVLVFYGACVFCVTYPALLTPAMQAHLGGHHPTDHYLRALAGGNGAWPVDRVMQLSLRTELPDDFLAKVDLATMAVSYHDLSAPSSVLGTIADWLAPSA